VLVVFIPLAFGIGWIEHQSNVDTRRLAEETALQARIDDWQLYDSQISACARANVLRVKQNAVIAQLHKHDIGNSLQPTEIVDCREAIAAPDSPRPSMEAS